MKLRRYFGYVRRQRTAFLESDMATSWGFEYEPCVLVGSVPVTAALIGVLVFGRHDFALKQKKEILCYLLGRELYL